MNGEKKIKIGNIAAAVLSLAVIVLAVLSMTGIWEDGIKVFLPIEGVLTLFSALAQRRAGNRKTFIICLVASVIIFICSAIVIIIG